MADPTDLVLQLLREIQTEISVFRKETSEHLTSLETGQQNIRSTLAARFEWTLDLPEIHS